MKFVCFCNFVKVFNLLICLGGISWVIRRKFKGVFVKNKLCLAVAF